MSTPRPTDDYLRAFCAAALAETAWFEALPLPADPDPTRGREWEAVEVLGLGLHSLPDGQREQFLAAATEFVSARPELLDQNPTYVGEAWWIAQRGPDACPGRDFDGWEDLAPELRHRLDQAARRSTYRFGAVQLDDAAATVRFV
ncbi:hypothetical protein OG618_37880 (plasmid) [Kitasatospora sp. NBC_01246]|uniref:hypothetical protein n=1 Tax=Kitasatospora sp. NBC_01246 TaxID=2903570 RepID=UPI002E34FD62|nr:hypothetical protein [Kitasatospora sp. NBC_01246]